MSKVLAHAPVVLFCIIIGCKSDDEKPYSGESQAAASTKIENPYLAQNSSVDVEFLRSGAWVDKVLKKGMTLDEVESVFGSDYDREETNEGFMIECYFDIGESGPSIGDALSISLYFESDILVEWVPTTFGGKIGE